MGKMYGSITRNAKDLWKFTFEVSQKRPNLINDFVNTIFKEKFLQILDRTRPDLILSVHPNFVGSIMDIFEEENIKIPFMTLLADIVSITPLWADARANITITPSEESKYKCMEYGVPENKIKTFGFPVRERFAKHNRTIEEDVFHNGKIPTFLIMSGGEGSGNMSRIAKILLSNFDCKVRILAGRNKILRTRLERLLEPEYPGRVEVYGFTENVQDLMLTSDIGIMRASPNTVMEAVNCILPVVITGALPGQEEGNPGFFSKHNLGVVCNKTSGLKKVISDLLADNGKKLKQIRQNQDSYRDPETARAIVDFMADYINKN